MSILTKIIGQSISLVKKSKQKTASIVKENCMQSVFERNLASVENPELKMWLEKSRSVLSEKMAQADKTKISTIIDDVIYKFNLCEDSNIKEKALELLKNIEGKTQKETFEIVAKTEHLLDAVNMAKQKYSVIRRSQSLEFNDILPKTRRVNNLLRRQYGNKLDNFTRFSGIRDFIEDYPQDTGMGKYLWEKYFLPYVKGFRGKEDGQSIVNILKYIEQNFGTKVFIDSKKLGTKEMLKFVKKEFDMQKKYSNGKAEFTPYLQVSKYDLSFAKNDSYGSCITLFNGGKYIKINDNDSILCLRHETEHFLDAATQKELINDLLSGQSKNKNSDTTTKNIKSAKKIIKLACKCLSPLHILKTYKNLINKKILLWKENREMKKAGISLFDRQYSRTNEREKKAVFVEGDMEKYSDKIKKRMVNNGVPEFMTKMPQHTKDYYYKLLKQMYRDCPEYKYIIDKLNKVLNGNLNNDIFQLFTAKNSKKYLERELEHYKEGETTTPLKFYLKFVTRQILPKLVDNFSKKFSQIIFNK